MFHFLSQITIYVWERLNHDKNKIKLERYFKPCFVVTSKKRTFKLYKETSNVLNGPTWWWESDKNRTRNIRKKSNEKLQKRWFPSYFQHFQREKMTFNTHLWAKSQKKLMVKSWENAQKPVFPVYFRHFRPGKIFFWKSGSLTLWALPFCTFVPKIRKN